MAERVRTRRERQATAEAAYRRNTKDLQTVRRNEDPKILQGIIKEQLLESSSLYPVIKKNLSGSAADAKHLKNLIHWGSEAAKRINNQSRPFDLRQVIINLKNTNIDLTEIILTCFRTAPTFEFFYGAIKQDGLVVKERQKKRAKIEMETTQTTSAKELRIRTDCEQDSTPKEVEAICEKIQNCRGRARFLSTIVDPISFTQTVENIFHTSFLVKEGRVGIKPDSSEQPELTYEPDAEDPEKRGKPRKQSILSFSMADFERWRQLIDEL